MELEPFRVVGVCDVIHLLRRCMSEVLFIFRPEGEWKMVVDVLGTEASGPPPSWKRVWMSLGGKLRMWLTRERRWRFRIREMTKRRAGIDVDIRCSALQFLNPG